MLQQFWYLFAFSVDSAGAGRTSRQSAKFLRSSARLSMERSMQIFFDQLVGYRSNSSTTSESRYSCCLNTVSELLSSNVKT